MEERSAVATSGTRSTSNNATWNVVAARDSLKKNGSQMRDVNAGSRQHTQGAGRSLLEVRR